MLLLIFFLFQCLIPVKSFLSPPETDLAVLRSYLSSLASASVIQQRAPLMYLIAVHHINQFFFRKDETTTEKNVTEMKLIIGKQLQIANSVPNTKQVIVTFRDQSNFVTFLQLSATTMTLFMEFTFHPSLAKMIYFLLHSKFYNQFTTIGKGFLWEEKGCHIPDWYHYVVSYCY